MAWGSWEPVCPPLTHRMTGRAAAKGKEVASLPASLPQKLKLHFPTHSPSGNLSFLESCEEEASLHPLCNLQQNPWFH